MRAPDPPQSEPVRSSATPTNPTPTNPTPENHGVMQSLVKVETLIQLVLFLPAAVVIGWAVGLALDRWLQQHWINIAGVIVGAVAGFVQIFRVVLAQARE